FTSECEPTDDSIMTIAVAKAILSCNGNYSNLADQAIICMQELGRRYPYAGYGTHFAQWLGQPNPKPYNSYGNGSAMRVSPCAYAADTLEEAEALARAVTEVTHNHPEGIKGALATTAAIFMALHGSSITEIRDYINQKYYPMNFTLEEIRPNYRFDVSCQGSVPQAIMAFLESTSFEDAIRNAISIGGDSDTIGAITGSIAEAYYGIPIDIRNRATQYLDEFLIEILDHFEGKYGAVDDKAKGMN
ncbi:MAG: ADP-ribosylglycohydrolase family protein, partial [Oscillospiraceae bacterium]|nr:ADP-ribosylglycohydrolase family protein [Oscillospiraceae bacterium]